MLNDWLILTGFSFIYIFLVLSHWWAWKFTAKLQGMGEWTLGFAGVALGEILYAVYLFTKAIPVAAVGYIVEAIGLVFVVRGCNIFILGRRGVGREIAIAGFGVVASMVFTSIVPDLNIRLLFGNLAFAVLQFTAAAVLIRRADPSLMPSLAFIPVCFILVGSIGMAQVALVLASSDPETHFRTKPLFMLLTQFAYFGLMLTALHLSYARFQNALAERIKERDTLLKEMHHRTKNNLAIVGSLVSLESAAFSDDQVKKAFARVGARLKTISLLHERMQDDNASRSVKADEYLSHILELANIDAKNPTQSVQTVGAIEKVDLDTKIALPLGIIVNELATNAIKHAFPGDRVGKLNVSLKKNDGIFELVVEDDGIGISNDRPEGSLGIGLVRALSEQVCGELTCEPRMPGTRYRLVFPLRNQDGSCRGK